MKMAKAAFAAGCFWHVQHRFSKLEGVVSTSAGYMGGDVERFPRPTYELVCSDRTGYAETVLVEFDPKKITFEKLLAVFWASHDPTQVNRQGLDVGTQYRSTVFYYGEQQKSAAEKTKAAVEKKLGAPVATQIVRAGKFFRAEEYHQDYLEKRGQNVCY